MLRNVFCALSILLPTGLLADWITLNDGSRIEGDIVLVTPENILIEVQSTPTILEQKSYSRSDIAKFRKSAQDDIAFAELEKIKIPLTADDAEPYQILLAKTVRPFMQNYGYSKHMPAARELAAKLEKDQTRLRQGEVKINGTWVSQSEFRADQPESGGRLQLAKMKDLSDRNPVKVMVAFEKLEKQSAATTSYPEGILLARQALGRMQTMINKMTSDIEIRQRNQVEGLKLASADRRLQMEQGIAREAAARDRRLAAAQRSGTKWIPLIADPKVLTEISQLAGTERARLDTIDVIAMQDGIKAAQDAQSALVSGQLQVAEVNLARANDLWVENPTLIMIDNLGSQLKAAQKIKEEEEKVQAEEDKKRRRAEQDAARRAAAKAQKN